MTDPSAPHQVSSAPAPAAELRSPTSLMQRTAAVCAWTGVGIGVVVLFGWLLDIRLLKSVLPGLVTMKPNTALCLLLLGTALGLNGRPRPHKAAPFLAALAMGIGAATLLEYVGGLRLGIDELLFLDPDTVQTSHPGRMSPATATSVTMLGGALLLLDRWRYGISHALVFCALFVTLLALTGYVYGVPALYRVGPFTSIALHTAAALLLMCAGTLCARPDRGLVQLLASDTAGGVLARRLAIPALILPLGVGWLRVAGQNAGLYPTEFGTSLFALSLWAMFTALIWWTGHHVRRAEEAMRALNVQLEQRVQERTGQLAAANRELESFSYSVAHDLRAPLRTIDGFSLALAEDCADKLDDAGRDHVRRIRAGTQRMAQLIDDLLSLSRVSRAPLNLERMDLSAAARAILSDFRQREPGRKIDAIVADGLVAEADPALVRAVLENLLGNAWKFTAKKPQARVEFGVFRQENGSSAYFVRDDGAGFDMAYADRLFGAFQRLHGQSEFPGNGIGLATVQRIVHRHRGRVWADGAVGGGATFYFTLG